MKVFATAMLAGAAAAIDAEGADHSHGDPHYTPNAHYDHDDAAHHHYGAAEPASPAYPAAPKLNEAVDAFDTYGTLFGEHRYQLQVAKTGYMLIGTEAIRESIASLQDRLAHGRIHVNDNDGDIDENDSDIEDNRRQIVQNRTRLTTLDGKIADLEHGYGDLAHKLAIDREAIVMMCHQYAYASAIPDECMPIIGGLAAPLPYAWNWPEHDCPQAPALPPFAHALPHYEKETTDDDDDKPNKNHHGHGHAHHAADHYHGDHTHAAHAH